MPNSHHSSPGSQDLPALAGTGPASPVRLSAVAQRQIRRTSAGVLLFYIVDALLLIGYGSIGTVSPGLGWLYGLAGIGASSLGFALFRARGWRADDLDTLTLAQCLLASLLMMATLGVAPRLGGMMLMSMMAVMALSALQLKGRVVVVLCVVLPVTSIGVLLSSDATAGIPTGNLAERCLTVLWLGWAMAKCSAHNIAGTELRAMVSDANIKLGNAFDALEKVASTDELTTLPNRRAIKAYLDQAVARAHEGDRPVPAHVGVALLDLDFFKRVNDRHGHDIGDRVLRVFGGLASTSVRPNDRIGRYGGEEFLLVFDEVRDASAAADAAERVRESIEKHDWSSVSPGLAITASIGVALVAGGADGDAAIQRADVALYEAKSRGRNRVVLADSAIVPKPAQEHAGPCRP